jgi:hypothetical protein
MMMERLRNPVRGDLFIAPGCVFSLVLQRRGSGRAPGMPIVLIAAAPLQNKRGRNRVRLATNRSPLTGLPRFSMGERVTQGLAFTTFMQLDSARASANAEANQ